MHRGRKRGGERGTGAVRGAVSLPSPGNMSEDRRGTALVAQAPSAPQAPQTIPPPQGQAPREGVTPELRGHHRARPRTVAPGPPISIWVGSRSAVRSVLSGGPERPRCSLLLGREFQSHWLAARSKAEQNSDSFSYRVYF